jgi:hypothetical protein
MPVRLAAATGEVRLPVEVRAGGQPLRLGEEVIGPGGGRAKWATFRAFLAEPHLLQGSRRVPAQFLVEGRPAAHGQLLLDAETPESLVIGLAAPPGDYTGLELGVGVPRPCNGGDPTRRAFPLNADGGMYWPWGSQYLFVMVEGDILRLHMGMNDLYRTARLEGALKVRTAGAGPTVVFDIDGLLTPDSADAEPINHLLTPPWVADHISAGKVLFFAR